MKKFATIFIAILIVLSFVVVTPNVAFADGLSDTINEQVESIDFSEFEEFFNSLKGEEGLAFKSILTDILNGKSTLDFNSFFTYFFKILSPSISRFVSPFLSVVGICIFCAILNHVKSNYFGEEISNLIFFVCLIFILGIILTEFFFVYEKAKIVIENMAKLVDIMSPIILTLMVASGATTSASVYKPTVLFLSQGILKLFSSVVLLLIFLMLIFSVLSNLSGTIKLKKYNEFFQGVFKWILGISVTVFSIFLTVQGITSATFDGVSIKAAKYAISNSIPMIGGFLKDGFDLVVAGSVIIKNSVGIIAVFCIIFIFLSPLIFIGVFSLTLKLTSAILEPIADERVSSMCTAVSKVLSYLLVTLLMVAFMVFMCVFLMIFSANAFI